MLLISLYFSFPADVVVYEHLNSYLCKVTDVLMDLVRTIYLIMFVFITQAFCAKNMN